ncbi:MAG: hypothetical protein CMM58_12385 [Rhodospirillaceae bacterium]|nr:hypothetical protein [Rhodospirillaceae bacterium]|tara:strand:- start:757 stop:1116 length:360 start_codon:yes stop_codon:yes gene_type:complete
MSKKRGIIKLIRLLFLVPLTVGAIIFAISNKHTVSLFFWPLSPSLEMPVYILSLGILIVGFILGNVFSWFDHSLNWMKRRKNEKKISELEQELSAIKQCISKNKKVPAKPTELSPAGNA